MRFLEIEFKDFYINILKLSQVKMFYKKILDDYKSESRF